jgi:hypothetical protein
MLLRAVGRLADEVEEEEGLDIFFAMYVAMRLQVRWAKVEDSRVVDERIMSGVLYLL